MNLRNLDDETLRKNTKWLAQEDRTRLVILLRHLRENEKRRLFSKDGFESIHEYVVEELKYSDDEAGRRISAMRLLRELPEIAGCLEDGSLNMTNACMARVLFKKEKKAGRKCSTEQKREIVGRLIGKSTRHAAKIVAEINPDMKKTKVLTYSLIENDELREKVLKVKGQFAHIDPEMTFEELLDRLCDMALDSKSPAAPRVDSEADIRRRVRERDGHKCTKCGSTHAVQEDHIVPVAAGGETTYENLRLLCRNCNLRAAIEFYGQQKMDQFLESPVRPYVCGPPYGGGPPRPRGGKPTPRHHGGKPPAQPPYRKQLRNQAGACPIYSLRLSGPLPMIESTRSPCVHRYRIFRNQIPARENARQNRGAAEVSLT